MSSTKFPIQNIILKKTYLEDVFEDFDGIQELYADNFDLQSTKAVLYVLAKKPINYSRLLDALSAAFPEKVSLHITYEAMSNTLAGRNLVWRLGRWYYDY